MCRWYVRAAPDQCTLASQRGTLARGMSRSEKGDRAAGTGFEKSVAKRTVTKGTNAGKTCILASLGGSWHTPSPARRMTDEGVPARGAPFPIRFVPLPPAARFLFVRQKETWERKSAKGNLFRGGSLWKPSPTTKGAPPPSNPNGGQEMGDVGRGTEVGLQKRIT